MTCSRSALVVLTAVAGSALVAAELVQARSSRRRLGMPRTVPPRSEAVVVLGYRDRARGGRANLVNRWRARIGLRSIDPEAGRSTLVVCGGAVGADVAEADLLARFLRGELGWDGPLVIERESRSTWQNIENAIPLIADAEAITIASNTLHAEKARAYLWMQRPDLARRLRRADDHRVGELPPLRLLATVIGARGLRGLPRRPL
ncbi:ElyC/SanA/YdcF family protein [Brachybacterium hainanense]|uniref:ElyC/SanA/YdcF family protein n=1 Tax=Brachybacterium hainanense TaxID=1541174 RepID=A0ABV6R9G3_9MICO